MCDPITLAGLALSTTAGVGQAVAANQVAQQQETANNAAVQYWRERQVAEQARQDRLRRQASENVEQGRERLAEAAQTEAIEGESRRLSDVFGPEDRVNEQGEIVGDQLLSGQALGDQRTRETIASELADATERSRERIAALANLSAYGGSEGGLQRYIGTTLTNTANEVARTQNLRQGGLNALQTELAVQPRQFVYEPSPLGAILSGVGNIMAFSGSEGLGDLFSGWFGTEPYGVTGMGLDPAAYTNRTGRLVGGT